MELDPAQTLARLIEIPSVNPMGNRECEPPFGEARLTDHLEALLRDLGLKVARQPVEPGRENLLARLDGDPSTPAGRRLVLLDAHQDTVPVEGMTIEPFAPRVDGGRMYGRGACDTKGGMAAMLVALARLAQQRPRSMPTVALACTVNEESAFSGAAALTRLWTGGSALLPRRPDAALVAEPTGLDVVVAHKGVVRWRCHTSGRACHSARPQDGDNAVYKMGRVLQVIERYARDVVPAQASHPLCGRGTLSVGTIHGGVSVNTVPDGCTIEIDRRLTPGEHPDQAQADLIDYLEGDASLDFPLRHESHSMQGPPLEDTDNGPLAERLAAVAQRVAGGGRVLGVPYATNAAFYAAAGVPSVLLGPGDIAQAHTTDEWIALDQLEAAAEIYFQFLSRFGDA